MLQQEFANPGKGAEDLGLVFGKMAKSLQGGSPDETFKKLGINLDELKKKTPAEQFRTLGAAINTVQDPSQKAASRWCGEGRIQHGSNAACAQIQERLGSANGRGHLHAKPRAFRCRELCDCEDFAPS